MKLKLNLSDPHTRAVWEAVQRAKDEVASWPDWKRGTMTSPRKPGRPPRAGKPALERVELRATSAELAAWTAKAEAAEVSLSEWIRHRCNVAR